MRQPLASLALLSLVAGGLPASAQEPEPLIESLDVRVVDVDVTVTDRQGNPVAGLTREDFEIAEDGEAQAITNFFAIENRRVRTSREEAWQPIDQSSRFRRRAIIVVDNNTLELIDRNSYLEALRDFLDQQVDDSYEWSVLAVGETVQVIQPLTNEKRLVHNAFDRIQQMPTRAANYAVERNILDDPTRAELARMRRELEDANGMESAGDLQTAIRFESRYNAMKNLAATQRTAEALLRVFRAYGSLEGQKVLVMVTGGIQMNPEYAFLGGARGESSPTDTGVLGTPNRDGQMYQMYNRLRQSVAAIAEAANAAQFRIYAMKASGLEQQNPQLDVEMRAAADLDNVAAFASPIELDDNVSAQDQLAGATGGLALASNRPLEDLERLEQDVSIYYSLGYSPARGADGRYHEIRVKTKRPGLIVRARQGYVDLSPEARLEQHLASPLTFEKDAGTLPVAVEVASGAGGQTATASLPLKNLTFIARGEEEVARLHVYLAVYDADGQPLDLVRRIRDVTFPTALRDQALTRELTYELRFRLEEAGDYTVGLTVVDELSGEKGMAMAALAI